MTGYYPLCGGILTGKYNSGNFPEDSRAVHELGGKTSCFKKMFSKDKKEKTLEK